MDETSLSTPAPDTMLHSSSTGSPAAAPKPADRSLRPWGGVILVLFVLTSTVGGSLALESSYLIVTLASHIGLALVTLGVAGYASMFIGRSYKPFPRATSGLASFSALVATIAGTVFLVEGQSDIALGVMEGFALLGIIMAILMIAVGGPSGKRAQV